MKTEKKYGWYITLFYFIFAYFYFVVETLGRLNFVDVPIYLHGGRRLLKKSRVFSLSRVYSQKFTLQKFKNKLKFTRLELITHICYFYILTRFSSIILPVVPAIQSSSVSIFSLSLPSSGNLIILYFLWVCWRGENSSRLTFVYICVSVFLFPSLKYKIIYLSNLSPMYHESIHIHLKTYFWYIPATLIDLISILVEFLIYP